MAPRTRSMAKKEISARSPFARLSFDIRWHIAKNIDNWADFQAFRHADEINIKINYRTTRFRTLICSVPQDCLIKFSNHMDQFTSIISIPNTVSIAFEKLMNVKFISWPTEEGPDSAYAAHYLRNIGALVDRIELFTPSHFAPLWESLESDWTIANDIDVRVELWTPAYVFAFITERMMKDLFPKFTVIPMDHAEPIEVMHHLDYTAVRIAVLFGTLNQRPPYPVEVAGQPYSFTLRRNNPHLRFATFSRMDQFFLYLVCQCIFMIGQLDGKTVTYPKVEGLRRRLSVTLYDIAQLSHWINNLEWYWKDK